MTFDCRIQSDNSLEIGKFELSITLKLKSQNNIQFNHSNHENLDATPPSSWSNPCYVWSKESVRHIGVDLAGIRAPKVGRCRMGWGMLRVSPFQPTRGMGERRELPQRGPKTDFGVCWRPQERFFLYLFDKIWEGQFATSPTQNSGNCSPPLIYAHDQMHHRN